MNNFKLVLLMMAMASMPLCVMADGNNSASSLTSILKSIPKPSGKGHRVPSHSSITCYYQAGELAFDIPADVECMDVSVIHEESGCTVTGTVDENTPSVNIGTALGLYSIDVSTDSGSEYAGSLEL
jgi:hypothetical protein